MEHDSKLAVGCPGDSWCPVTCTARVLDRIWHPVIVDRLLREGPTRFNALRTAVDGVSAKVLSEHLDDLAEKGIVERHEVDGGVEYALTARGQSLEPVVVAMREWGLAELEPPA